MKAVEFKCAASLDMGILTLETGETIDLDLLYETLAELRDYAENSTLSEDALPSCVYAANKLLDALELMS